MIDEVGQLNCQFPDAFWVIHSFGNDNVKPAEPKYLGLLRVNWFDPDGVQRCTEDNRECLNGRSAVAAFYTEDDANRYMDGLHKAAGGYFFEGIDYTPVDVTFEQFLLLNSRSKHPAKALAMCEEGRNYDNWAPPELIKAIQI